MATILDTLRGLVTPELAARVSGLLGESESNVSRGLGAAFPAILAALLGKSSDMSAMRQIMDLLGDRSIDSSLIRNAASLLGSGGLAKSPVTELGGRFLASVFGPQMGSVTNALADHAGLKTSSASSLLGLAAPLVMALLGDRVRREGLSASGLANVLSSERDSILRDLPAGLASLLGLGAAPRAPLRELHREPPRRTGAWLGAALAGLLALAGLWALTRDRSTQRIAEAPGTPPKQVASASPTDVPPMGTFKKRLPTNFEVTAPVTGIERQVIVFIEDPAKGAEPAIWFNFDRLLFETASATLKPESTEQLRNVAEILKAYPNVKVKIGGYTDNVGDPASNLKLSQDRATNVMNELVKHGVPANRLSAEGYGEQHPVADNTTETGRQQNRRIALRVTEK